jgi:DNA-binding HxlR family transcriptional regulator
VRARNEGIKFWSVLNSALAASLSDLTSIKSMTYPARTVDDQLLTTLKALSDASRLRIVGLLAAGPYAVAELSAALELTPGTVVHHLKRLQAAGLVASRASHPYVEYSLCLERLHAVGRQLGELERTTEQSALLPGPDGRPLPAFEARALRSFIVDGRLVSIPAQEKKKLVVLRYLLERCFADDRPYPEKEVNQQLALFHPDVASLRRYLVAYGLVTRQAGIYRRA